MQCQICFEKFDHSKHKPYVLIPCTHTLCITCLNNLPDKKCPSCTRVFMDKNPNWALLDLVGDSDYDLLKIQLERSFNEYDILKKKLNDVHQRKLEENNQKLNIIRNEITRRTNQLVNQLKENEKRLLNETQSIELLLSSSLNEIASKLNRLNANLDNQIELNKKQLEANELTELQMNKLGQDLFNLNLEFTFKIDQIKKFNESDLVEFEPNQSFDSMNIDLNLIGKLNNKGKLNENDEKYEEKLLQRGVNLLESKQTQEAVYFFEKSIELNPKNAYAYKSKGNAMFELGHLSAAIECYNKAIELDSNYKPGLEYKKALVYKEMKDYTRSLECFELSLSLNSNYDFVHYNKGNVFYELKEYSKALECFEKALELKPNANAMIHSSRALCLYHLKEYDNAIESLTKSLQIDPFNPVTYSSLGLVCYELKDYYKTIDCFEKAIQLEPKNTNNYAWKATVYAKLREYDKALQCYEKIIELEPNNSSAQQNRDFLLNELI